MKKARKVNENKKKKQARSAGLLSHTNHRSHASGRRWLRVWNKREHLKEMAEVAHRFESKDDTGG